jgi:alkane 1-monooxygenase
VLPALAVLGFFLGGFWTFGALIFSFVIIPLLEWIIGEGREDDTEYFQSRSKRKVFFILITWLTVPVQYTVLILFFYVQSKLQFNKLEFWGNITAMGMMCGVFGINVAHELGHSTLKFEQFLSKLLLFSSLYLHFFVEHNKGHHKWIGTPHDPATARMHESLYCFFMRVIPNSLKSAWKIAANENKRKQKWKYWNEVSRYILIQSIAVIFIFLFLDWTLGVSFVLAAFMGILLLETVNYIEHYGLMRAKVSEKRYAEVAPIHSWNSNFIVGRSVLFELTRHSDHHANPERPFESLRSLPEAGKMPAGYPAMMLLALIPFLWFKVMNSRVEDLKNLEKNLAD